MMTPYELIKLEKIQQDEMSYELVQCTRRAVMSRTLTSTGGCVTIDRRLNPKELAVVENGCNLAGWELTKTSDGGDIAAMKGELFTHLYLKPREEADDN